MNRRRLSLGAGVVAVAAAGLWWFYGGNGSTTEKKSPPPAAVLTARAELADITLTLELTGRTEAPESVSVKARVDGQVAAVEFAEGRHLRRGDVLVRLDSADFDARRAQAEANLARDQAQAVKAQADLDRALSLRSRGFVADAAVDSARAALASAQATAAADQAALDLARLQLDYTTLRAPFDGVVGARLVFPGTAVKANDTVVAVVNRVRPLLVTFSIPEKHLSHIRAGLKSGTTNSTRIRLPGDSDAIDGKLRFLDNAVDTSTGTLLAKAEIANSDERLSPGQFVAVVLPLESLRQVVTVPTEAVQQGPEGAFVYVVGEGDVAQLRKVKVTADQSGRTVIGEGLAAGETVVTDGQLRLVPGARLRPAGTK